MSPLQGITVLDLSRILAGPWATQLLADFGATVIKVEKPGEGDDTRRWGPPWVPRENGAADAAYFFAANRNKQSVCIDFACPEGQQLVRALAQRADVLVENYKCGALQKYGLDYASLKALNPRLVYCSITGFGHSGPRADEPGYDAVVQGMGGLMSITGEPESEGGMPVKVGVAVADLMTGMYAANAIQAALIAREKSGKGQHIDLALFDCQLAMLANQAMNYLVSGVSPGRLGSAHPNIVPYQVFAAQDGHLMLAVGNDAQFRRLCEALQESWADDERFAQNAVRVANRSLLVPMIAARLREASRDVWLARLSAAQVPASAVNTVAQAFADPQTQARQMLKTVAGCDVPLVNNPVKFSGDSAREYSAPPILGQDTTDVLATLLGLSEAELAVLRENHVIA